MARRSSPRSRSLALLLAGGLFGASVGVATGAIPATGTGVFTACYDSGGNVKLIDTAKTATCPKGHSGPVSWNQAGVQGPEGIQGPAGPQGLTGATGAAGPAGGNEPAGLQGPAGPAGPAGPSTLAALEGTPCSADTSSGIVSLTTGTGEASVPITFACIKTPTVTVTVTGGALSINLRDHTLLSNHQCSATSCVRAFVYGDFVRVLMLSEVASGAAPTFHYACPPSSGDSGTTASTGLPDRQEGECEFRSITTDATVTVTFP